MKRPHRAGATALLLALLALFAVLVGACSSSPSGTAGPGSTTVPPAATPAGGDPTNVPVASEPCSFLTAEQVAVVIGTAPVEVKERAGRGDCDYFLTAAKDQKVNVGVTPGADGQAIFDSTKDLGDPQPMELGDEAYSINLEEVGTVVLVHQGDTVVVVQVLTTGDAADQLAKATAIAQAVVAGL